MAKQTGCVLNPNHAGECYVGTKTYDCGDAQQSAEIAKLRADLAEARRLVDRLRMEADNSDDWRDEAIAERDAVRADLARVTAERDVAVASYRVSEHQREEACRDRDRAMAERAVARADLARMTRALADERAAVAIAHERIATARAKGGG